MKPYRAASVDILILLTVSLLVSLHSLVCFLHLCLCLLGKYHSSIFATSPSTVPIYCAATQNSTCTFHPFPSHTSLRPLIALITETTPMASVLSLTTPHPHQQTWPHVAGAPQSKPPQIAASNTATTPVTTTAKLASYWTDPSTVSVITA